jgi:large subunit ribosomal protein L25
MERPNIEAEIRTERGKNAARRVRMGHKVPGVLYGAGGETLALTLDPKRLLTALHSQTGHNTIFDLRLKSGDSSPAMIVETQIEPVRGILLHVDLKRIAMDQMLKVSVPVITTGESKGVKTQGGLLEVVIREVEVECLPADIPDHIMVAVDNLMLGESIRLADLQQGLGEKVKLTGDLTTVICHVVTPKAEEVAPVAEVVAEGAAEPEVIKKGKAVEEGAEAAEKSEKGDKGDKGDKKK